MKKIREYVVLVVIIIVLAVILGWQQSNKHKNANNLPVLPTFTAQDLTRMEIKTPEAELSLAKNEAGEWVLMPQGYPVEKRLSTIMEEGLANFKLTAIISESAEDYARYELDDSKKVAVKAYTGDTLVLDMDLGAAVADNFRHNYVKMAGNPNVYHGRGNLRTFFDTNEFELRQKQIMNFDPAEIETITMNFGGVNRSIFSQHVKDVDGNDIKIWLGPDGTYIDSGMTEDFLNFVKSTNVYEFLPQNHVNLGPTVYILTLTTADEDNYHVLRIFEPDPDYLATVDEEYSILFDAGSTDVLSPFQLAYAQQNDILKRFDEILQPPEPEAEAAPSGEFTEEDLL